AEIDDDPEGIHFLHRFLPKRGQASRVRFHYTCSEGRLTVIRELHHAYAEIAEEFEAFELPLQHVHALEGKDDPHLPLTFGAVHVGRDSHLHEIYRMDLD